MGSKFKYQVSIVVILSFCNLSIFSQEISTIGEIYDFEIGDILHYQYSFNAPNYGESSYTNIEILDRYYSQANDTLFYVRDIAYQEISSGNPTWTFDFYIDTIWYSELDSLINMGQIDSVYSNINLYNGRITNYWEHITTTFNWNKKFVIGCGRASFHNISSSAYTDEYKELIYYKKGEEEWGTPIIVSIDKIGKLKQNVFAYPNPAKNKFYIESPESLNKLKYLEIYSVNGMLVKYQEFENNYNSKIDIKNLKEGLYIIKIVSENEIHQIKLIKE